MSKTKNDLAWERLFKKYEILNRVDSDGLFKIKSAQINEFREARLMTKFDFKSHLPILFTRNKLSILPVTRGTYVIARFNAYKDFENINTKLIRVSFPEHIESLDFKDINSEAMALSCAYASSMIADFMEDENIIPTVSGRMSSSSFDFAIDRTNRTGSIPIRVKNSQVEIDGGFEGNKSLAIIEAKNIVSDDFIVRQLYYPYRLWKDKVGKKVRPIFMNYTNDIFTFYEYEFEDPYNYNSLVLLRQKNYIIDTEEINKDDIILEFKTTKLIEEPHIPFPQADSFERLINLCEDLLENVLTQEEIYLKFDIQPRQADYYANAGRYLGLIDRQKIDGITKYCISNKGRTIMTQKHKPKQLSLVNTILEHAVFYEAMKRTFDRRQIPINEEIVEIMLEKGVYNISSNETFERRAKTVSSWIKWILELAKE